MIDKLNVTMGKYSICKTTTTITATTTPITRITATTTTITTMKQEQNVEWLHVCANSVTPPTGKRSLPTRGVVGRAWF